MSRWLLLPVALLLAGLARAEPSFHDLDWFDDSRQRPVPVRLYWPEEVR